MKNLQLFDAYYLNSVGVWYFIPDDLAKYQSGLPTFGFGCIRYDEGSTYVGEIWFDGINYYKEGYGQQDFTHSTLGQLDPYIGEKKYKFVGHFDYKRNNWIYGNGVLYYVGPDGKPSHFIKGFFRAMDKVREFEGNFDYSTLLEGYSSAMEFDYDAHRRIFSEALKRLNQVSKVETLLLGDSYFEFWNYPEYAGSHLFQHCFDVGREFNLGVGGSTFEDWLDYLNRIELKACPKRIVINLGFNDLHCGYPLKAVCSNALYLYRYLHRKFYKSEITFLCVAHAPGCAEYLNVETEYNKKLTRAGAEVGFRVSDLNCYLKADGENCFHSDKVHLNERGYRALIEALKGSRNDQE